MKSQAEILRELIGFAEEGVTRTTMQPDLSPDGIFPALAREIRRLDALPAEGVRTTRAAVVMIIALEEFFSGDREPTSPWLMLAGTTLPLLRGEAWTATRNEKEARVS